MVTVVDSDDCCLLLTAALKKSQPWMTPSPTTYTPDAATIGDVDPEASTPVNTRKQPPAPARSRQQSPAVDDYAATVQGLAARCLIRRLHRHIDAATNPPIQQGKRILVSEESI
jgi:hypothetical protein